jgi:hypothetical protein
VSLETGKSATARSVIASCDLKPLWSLEAHGQVFESFLNEQESRVKINLVQQITFKI